MRRRRNSARPGRTRRRTFPNAQPFAMPALGAYRIPPGTDAAHAIVIAVNHLQRRMVRLRSRHRRRWGRIRRRVAERFKSSMMPPKAADGFQLDRLPPGADFAATPSMLDQKVRRRAHIE